MGKTSWKALSFTFLFEIFEEERFSTKFVKNRKTTSTTLREGQCGLKKPAKFEKESINMLYYFLEMFTNRTAHSQQSVSVPLPITECMC